MMEEDSSAIKVAQAGLSEHDGRRRHLGLGFFLPSKLSCLIPHYEKDLLYY